MTAKVPSNTTLTEDVKVIITGNDDLTISGSDVINNIVTLTKGVKGVSKTFKVIAKTDAVSDSGETVKLKYQVKSDDSAYEGFAIPDTSFTINEVKAKFTKSDLVYSPTAVANTLKFDGLSNAALVDSAGTLIINGDLKTQAGSGFTTNQRVAITSSTQDLNGDGDTSDTREAAADESSRSFKITGSDGSKEVTQTIAGPAAGKTVFTTQAFKTVTEIKLVSGSTGGPVSAGLATALETSSYDAAQAATYTITASEIPEGIDPLVVNLSSPVITAVFDYDTTSQATTREFIVDSDKISALSSGQVTGALTLIGTPNFTSPHYVTITSEGNDSGGYFQIIGKNENNVTKTDYERCDSSGR